MRFAKCSAEMSINMQIIFGDGEIRELEKYIRKESPRSAAV
jgi:hypothetical protein